MKIQVCLYDELPIGLGRAFQLGEQTVAVFRFRSGRLAAVDNRCPHKNGPLAEGMLADEQIVCPMHSFRFDAGTGACDQPNVCAVKTYPTELRDGWVYVTV